MAEKDAELIGGTLIRGADGALYFVEDDSKWARRLPDQFTEDARTLLDEAGFVPKKEELPAFHGTGLARRMSGSEHEIAIELNRLAMLMGLRRRSE